MISSVQKLNCHKTTLLMAIAKHTIKWQMEKGAKIRRNTNVRLQRAKTAPKNRKKGKLC
jgi:hypothetical protein